jgi:hypothetical protein
VRALAVVLGVLYAACYSIPTILQLTGFYGTTGIVKAGSFGTLPAGTSVTLVGRVVPDSPAARAGIVPGDTAVRVEAEHSPPYLQLYDRVPAGRPIPFAVVHEGQRRVVGITPVAVRPPPAEAALVVAALVRGFVIVLIGALLVLLRPSVMTAAFFLACLEFGELAHPANNLELLVGAPLFLKPLCLLLTCLVFGASPAIAAIFCMRFPTGEPLPSWRPVERVMLGVAAATVVVYLLALLWGATFTPAGSALYRAYSVASWLSYAVAVAAFMVRYARASGEDKARLRWVAIGLGSFLVSFALFWAAENLAGTPRLLSTWAQFVNVLPLTVLYAVLRHRVIDVRLAGGRAIAFAVISAVPVIAFSVLDWAVGNGLQQSKFASVLEVAVAVGFGFWVNASQRRIDDLIERVFFHARRLAEQRLRAVARRLPHVTGREALDETIVREVYEALEVSWCALYRRADGAYRRVAERGAAQTGAAFVDENDPLVLELVTTGEQVTTPAGEGLALACPLLVRHDLEGFIRVGPRRDGERFDALERAALAAFAEAAAAAYDHLDAVEQRAEAESVRRLLDDLRRENALLREMLAGERSAL